MVSAQVPRYSFSKRVAGKYEDVLERVKQAFKAEGFGVITEIDLQRTFAEKIGEKIEPYTILGMCNPNLASRAIAIDHEIGLLLPCNVIVHDGFGEVSVSAQDPEMLMKIVGRHELEEIATEAKNRMLRAIQML